MKRTLTLIGTILVGTWLAVVVALFVLQRKMVFAAPPPLEVVSSEAVQHVTFGPEDALGHALFAAPRPGGPVVVHFHSNAEQLAGQAEMARIYGGRGIGFLAVEYPGYGPMADQEPSEAALIEAGERALRWLKDTHDIATERIVLQGRSLGSGVAVALASKALGSRLLLLSPFRSLVAAAQSHYPWVPVGLLLRDRFDSERRASEVDMPVLVIHGDRDVVVPYAQGKALSAAFDNGSLRTVNGAGHNDLIAAGGSAVLAEMMQFALGALAVGGGRAGGQ